MYIYLAYRDSTVYVYYAYLVILYAAYLCDVPRLDQIMLHPC